MILRIEFKKSLKKISGCLSVLLIIAFLIFSLIYGFSLYSSFQSNKKLGHNLTFNESITSLNIECEIFGEDTKVAYPLTDPFYTQREYCYNNKAENSDFNSCFQIESAGKCLARRSFYNNVYYCNSISDLKIKNQCLFNLFNIFSNDMKILDIKGFNAKVEMENKLLKEGEFLETNGKLKVSVINGDLRLYTGVHEDEKFGNIYICENGMRALDISSSFLPISNSINDKDVSFDNRKHEIITSCEQKENGFELTILRFFPYK